MRRKLLLVGWDAADWKVIEPLMAAGDMPNVERLVRRGARGAIATLHPPLSPMLWTSIATGKRPFRHGIHGFTEPSPDGRGVRPVTNLSRTAKALWNIFSQEGLRSVVVGWWPSHPAEPLRGVMVSDHYHRAHGPEEEGWPLRPGTVHPEDLAETLAALRIHPDRLTPEAVTPFVPLAAEIDQERDKRLGLLLRTLAEAMSIEAAARWLLEREAWDFGAVYFEALDHFCHGFMRYHPPRQTWVSERDFELYGGVVAEAYRLHDRMLGRLITAAGEDATVILMSDHGFHPDHLRPPAIPDIPAGPAIEHRDYGILAMGGPGIRAGEVVYGASVLDVAPTILTLFGLPVGEDMDGKALGGALEAAAVRFVPSWEEIPGDDGRHPATARFDPVAAHEMLEQMVALGYVERPDADREKAARATVRELRFNLGEAYQDAGRHAEAREIFAELHAADPDEIRYLLRLFVSCQALGMLEEMRRTVEEAARSGDAPVIDYLRAQVLAGERRYGEAAAVLETLEAGSRDRTAVLLQLADWYLRGRRREDARRAYAEAAAIDPDSVHAHAGLARVALGRRDYDAAAHAALNTLERRHEYAGAHYLLGRALAGMKEYGRAVEAFRAAVYFHPNFPEAHLRLAALLEKSDAGAAREHRELAREMRHGGREPVAERAEIGRDAPPAEGVSGEERPLADSVIVVTGLPRSGTSLMMQMLAAGGVDVLTDGRREADDDNPRGYLEFEPVKNLLNDAAWLEGARGKAVKIVAPLLAGLPAGLPCRVILCDRDLDEVLDSQERMLRHGSAAAPTAERRRLLKEEFARTLARVRNLLAERPATRVLLVDYEIAVLHPAETAKQINAFLGGGLDEAKMAAAADARLYRNRAGTSR